MPPSDNSCRRARASRSPTTPPRRTALWVGVLNNDAELEAVDLESGEKAYRIVGDPTEGALLVAAAKAGAYHVDLKEAYPRQSEVPLNSERKRMITVHDVRHPGRRRFAFLRPGAIGVDVIVVKGAPDVVLAFARSIRPHRTSPGL